MIKAIYRIPSIKHTFLIVGPHDTPSLKHLELEQIGVEEESLEHILRWKDHIGPKEALRWTQRVVSFEEFLEVVEKCTPIGRVSSIQSSRNPEDLELLAINLLKTPVSPSESLDSSKYLGFVPDEDVLEVFI